MNRIDPLSPPVTVCVLCYGNYPTLAQRCLGSLACHTPLAGVRLRLGLNSVCAETEKVLEQLLPHFDVELLVHSETNLYKNGMMRRLFYDKPIQTPWTIWFDDDSFVFRADWLHLLQIESRLRPEIDMWGRKCFIRGDDWVRDFISTAAWFRGLEPEPDNQPGKFRVNFAVGSFWALRTCWIYELNWPDRRLVHIAEDYMLGEALRQAGARIAHAQSGVKVNQAKRRTPPEMPRILHA
jgi:GT2 family glycosyltransferase